MIEFIATNDELRASGHYSQAVVHNGFVYVSGQLPFDFKSGEPVHGSAKEQARAVLTNLNRVLQAADSRLELVLRCTLYLSDIQLWDEVNEVYSEFFGEHKPARTVVPTTPLHFGFKIEADAIAVVDDRNQ